VGARIDRHLAALGDQCRLLAAFSQQAGDFVGIGVIDLNDFGAQRFALTHGLVRFSLGSLQAGDFVQGRYAHDIADAPNAETLGAQYDAEGLIPRHVVQLQGDIAVDAVGHHHVDIVDFGNDLQYRADINFLE